MVFNDSQQTDVIGSRKIDIEVRANNYYITVKNLNLNALS